TLLISNSVYAGVWLNLEGNDGIDLQTFNSKLNWLDQQNDRNPNVDPWQGMRVYLTWGEIPYTGDKNNPDAIQYDFSNLVDLLNTAHYRGDKRSYQIALTVSDKLWVFQHNAVYPYKPGALPRFYAESMGSGDWTNDSVIPDGSSKLILAHEDENGDGAADNLRFAVANSHTNSSAARKYSVVRWNPHIKNLWYRFWQQLAHYTYLENGIQKALKDHPALHGIITPESSLSGINHNNSELNAIGYTGADAYADLMLDQAIALNRAFTSVPIISSINWISENASSRSAPYYQQYLGDQLSSMNQSSGAYGWFAQDLRFDAQMGKSSYENNVYPEFDKFESSLRYAMITGDTYNNSQFSSTSAQGKANELMDFANTLGIGHLLFLNQEQGQGPGINAEAFNLIAAAYSADYSFMPVIRPSMTSAAVYEGPHANRIAVTLSDAAGNLSAMDFSVTIDTRLATISNVARHPTDSSKIWLSLAARVYAGDEIEVAYGGTNLQVGAVAVTNYTTSLFDPPPAMQSAIVYEGIHADRIALSLSEAVENVSEDGFSIFINGQATTISRCVEHPSDPSRIWIYLADRIYLGEETELHYDGSGRVVDAGGNDLVAGRFTVVNRTTSEYDPAPIMQSAIVYKGSHENRLAVTVSEAVNDVHKRGFSVIVDGRKRSILRIERHPTNSAKLWIFLSDPIEPGERVTVRYNGQGTIEDNMGNAMDAGTIEVTNAT
ncbi:MAG: hypothetical protein ABW092_20500, partial [Candidatus Thiodiazotropha sp.]